MKALTPATGNGVKIVITLMLLSAVGWLHGQGSAYSYYYRVYFRDKGENSAFNYVPIDQLSTRALDRRQKAGIPVPDFRDIPVYKGYLNKISSSVF